MRSETLWGQDNRPLEAEKLWLLKETPNSNARTNQRKCSHVPAAGFPSATAASPVFTSKFLSMLANLMLPDHPVQEPKRSSAISQRQNKRGTRERSTVILNSVQGATERLLCDLNFHSMRFWWCVASHYHNCTMRHVCIWERGNHCWPWPPPQLQSDATALCGMQGSWCLHFTCKFLG